MRTFGSSKWPSLTARRLGFVLSGMNLGVVISPFIGGILYAYYGYYAVFSLVFSVMGIDLFLRAVMIEKQAAADWLRIERHNLPNSDEGSSDDRLDQTKKLKVNLAVGRITTATEAESGVSQGDTEPDEASSLLHGTAKPSNSRFSKAFPAMTILLGSPRFRAALLGVFIQTTIITAFDATLPLFVKRTFAWHSTGAGLIFLAVSIPSLLGMVAGFLSDLYGPKKLALSGFILTTLCLALLGLVKVNSLGDKLLLCILLVFIGSLFSIHSTGVQQS